MQKEVNTEQEELNTSQTNVFEIHKDKSITNEPLENTPFRIVGNDERGYVLVMGLYRITEYQKTKAEAIALLDKEQWNITITMIAAAIDATQTGKAIIAGETK